MRWPRSAGAAVLVTAALAVSGCGAAATASSGSAAQVVLLAAAAGQLTPTQSCGAGAGALAPTDASLGAPGSLPGQNSATGDAVAGQLQGEGAVLLARAAATTPWGQDPQTLLTAVMVGLQESSGNPRAGNQLADGRTHQGLWQVSSLHSGIIAAHGGDRFDPAANAAMAYDLWKAAYDRDPGEPWQPWEAFTSGAYLRHEGAARKGIAEAHLAGVSEAAHADLGSDPCIPNDAGQTGAELAGDGAAVPCGAGEGRVETTPDGGSIRVCSLGSLTIDSRQAGQVQRMVADAAAAGLTLSGSGFRSSKRQAELRAQNCDENGCSPPTAPPGKSQHEFGRALDLTCDGALIRSRTSPCYTFLASTGGGALSPAGSVNEYGFRNLKSEPWHWSFGPKAGS